MKSIVSILKPTLFLLVFGTAFFLSTLASADFGGYGGHGDANGGTDADFGGDQPDGSASSDGYTSPDGLFGSGFSTAAAAEAAAAAACSGCNAQVSFDWSDDTWGFNNTPDSPDHTDDDGTVTSDPSSNDVYRVKINHLLPPARGTIQTGDTVEFRYELNNDGNKNFNVNASPGHRARVYLEIDFDRTGGANCVPLNPSPDDTDYANNRHNATLVNAYHNNRGESVFAGNKKGFSIPVSINNQGDHCFRWRIDDFNGAFPATTRYTGWRRLYVRDGYELQPTAVSKTGGSSYTESSNHTFSGTVRNNGDINSPGFYAQFEIDYYRNGSVDYTLSRVARPGLSVGASDSFTDSETFAIPAGNHRYRLAQVPYVLGDTNTGNQYTDWTNFTVSSIPLPTSPNFSCNAAGDQMTFTWDLPSGYTESYFRMYDDVLGANVNWDDGLFTSKVISVVPGRSYDWWIHTKSSTGGNPDHSTPELRENNITCVTPPDLDPTVTVYPSGPINSPVGGSPSLAAVVANIGGSASTDLYRNHLYLHKNNNGTWSYYDNIRQDNNQAALNPGLTREYSGTYTFTEPGIYRVVDWVTQSGNQNQYPDANPANNWTSGPAFSVLPDITGLDYSCSNNGTQMDVSWDAAGAPTTQYYFRITTQADYDDGNPLDDSLWNNNVLNTSYSVPVTTGETYRIWVHTRDDAGMWGTEAVIENASCLPSHDLYPSSTIEPYFPGETPIVDGFTVTQGDTVDLHTRVINTGPGDSTDYRFEYRIANLDDTTHDQVVIDDNAVITNAGVGNTVSDYIRGTWVPTTPGNYILQTRIFENNSWNPYDADTDATAGNDYGPSYNIEVEVADVDLIAYRPQINNQDIYGRPSYEAGEVLSLRGSVYNGKADSSGFYRHQFRVINESDNSVYVDFTTDDNGPEDGYSGQIFSGVEWVPTIVGNFSIQSRILDNNGNTAYSADNDATVGNDFSPLITVSITANPDLDANAPSLINGNSDGDLTANTNDDGQFAAVVDNLGDTITEPIDYTYTLEFSDGTLIDRQSGSRNGGVPAGGSMTLPLVSFNNLAIGEYRINVEVDSVAGENILSNNTSPWTIFSVVAEPPDGIPKINADPKVIRADSDTDPDTIVSWDTDQYVSCILNGPGLDAFSPAAASETPDPGKGVDGSAALDLNNTAEFTIDCGSGAEASVKVQVLPTLFEI